MPASIQIKLCALSHIVDSIPTTDRKAWLQHVKAKIMAFRNAQLEQYFELTLEADDIAVAPKGKPYLSNFPQYAFNQSHTKDSYALAMSAQIQNLGIDIEQLSRNVRFDALAQHAFHPEELKTWQDSDFDLSYWFKVWTTKEAVLKAAGLGIRINLNEFNTQVHPIHDGGMCQHPNIGHFSYQNMQVGDVMLTVAWAADASCKGFSFPQIELHSALI